ncbi:MAG: AzlC family ABC transporter permease [Aminivibrio sp.]|jgi:predicted branched-subunit amino acid permease|nr:branched-chain amino acid ABC transporter permease [Synergistaceae bacterium]
MNQDFRLGFRASIPTGIGVLVYGLVFGVLAAEKGVTAPQLAFMNTIVFSGSAQLIVVGMWGGGVPAWQMALAAAVVNVRYFLLTAAVAPLLTPFGKLGAAWRVHFVTDENWAITMAESRKRAVTGSFLLGGGVCVGLFWFVSVMAGHGMGFTIPSPERFGLDFAFTALFAALAVTMWRGKRDVIPWAVSAAVAYGAFKLLPDAWYVLLGGTAGAVSAVFTGRDGE